ncbi:MAG: hypothetical protein IPL92_07955 [Saprospiraceae bacterium]|nr:hypothetical protein [Candidatus Opimibacter iunctus]
MSPKSKAGEHPCIDEKAKAWGSVGEMYSKDALVRKAAVDNPFKGQSWA